MLGIERAVASLSVTMKEPFHEQHLLTAKECDELIALWGQDHGHGGAYKENREYISKRTSIVTMPTKIFDKLRRAVDKANKAYWRYNGKLSVSGEIYRYTRGDFFDWHMDLGDGDIAKRKITTLIQLSNPKDYGGGNLELFANETHTAGTRRGTLLIYPSYIMHRVTKVTRGVRYSIGGEVVGKPFV